ncbi:spore coat protein GerQ [Geobacillus stearothermophilus]|uniref:spore coat protein GerQ n=1 Tax=Geobacillus stearothermophilus TaxID=1422 RepID=UPI002E1F0CE1|nr:spore coat protein GerQ [Geobacillus stearothermophilus]MED4271220.1 spore coat protein GerQ [Geobacillus stearothermophilus]
MPNNPENQFYPLDEEQQSFYYSPFGQERQQPYASYPYGYPYPQPYYPAAYPYYYYPQAAAAPTMTPATAAAPTFGLQAPTFTAPTPMPTTTGPSIPGMLPIEESYIENILRLNKGKVATIYATFENNREWNAKVFRGVIEAAGRDHVILSDPQTGTRYLIPMIYLDYVMFEGEIAYEYPFAGATAATPLATYSPR